MISNTKSVSYSKLSHFVLHPRIPVLVHLVCEVMYPVSNNPFPQKLTTNLSHNQRMVQTADMLVIVKSHEIAQFLNLIRNAIYVVEILGANLSVIEFAANMVSNECDHLLLIPLHILIPQNQEVRMRRCC